MSLGALGGGGSILTVPALVYVIGQDARAATTSSLFIVGISSLIAAFGHARSGRMRWGVGVVFGVTGIPAGFAGTAANQLVHPDVLLLAFSGVIVIAAVGMLTKSRSFERAEDTDRQRVAAERSEEWNRPSNVSSRDADGHRWSVQRAAKVVGAGLAVGFMTGFFGVGGGFVIVPALTLALGMSMPQAVATSLVVISINSAGALLARAGTAHFDWAVIAPFTVAAIAGSLGGKKLADRVSGTTLTRAFAVLLIAVAVYTATSSLVSLLG
ncbi:MAG: sulfite exporter TauE/SafE family protein [Actinomycetota bacterium]|nr:sulfite exporter TauE/SafE family protein [Actinomycetota bacterium]